MAILQAIEGLGDPGHSFELGVDCTVLGRHPDCDVVLELGAVSRQHARILKIGDEYFVEDLHSRNGTFLNGQRVETRRRLADNDLLKICDLVFAFRRGTPPDTAETAASAGIAPPAAISRGADDVVLVDDERPHDGSSVLSKLDVSTGSSGLRIQVNAEAKLKALLAIGRNLGGAVRLEEVLPKLLDNLFAIFIQADRGFILLKDAATGKLVPRAVKQRQEQAAQPIRISRTIVHGVLASKEAVLSADATTDSRFGMSESIVDFQIHSMMCAPLVGSEGRVLGVIQIDTLDQRRRFNRDDLDVLASVACQAAVAVENAQLHEIAMIEGVLQRELALAHKVQRGLLPSTPPTLLGYEFFDFYEPASHLGGDYFDYISLPGDRLAVALADVSGKGIAASLLVARLSAEVRYCLASLPTPAEAMERLNSTFCESRWEDRFVTMVIAVLDPKRHEVTLVNAGHWPPLLCGPADKVEPVGATTAGLPLGVDAETKYQQCLVKIEPGNSLVFFTDGITDAWNVAGKQYRPERLRQQLAASAGAGDLGAMGRRIIDDVRRFIGVCPQADDMCLTCLRRVG
jgi:phosphoserine phosphatase RsbU/P